MKKARINRRVKCECGQCGEVGRWRMRAGTSMRLCPFCAFKRLRFGKKTIEDE